MFKRILLVLFAIVLLSGCVAKAPTPASTVVTVPQQEGTYYFLAANVNEPFYIPGMKGMDAAGKIVGMKTELVGPTDISVAGQMKTFEELIASPTTKGILWYSVDFNAGEPLVEEARAKGIPVIVGAMDSPFKNRSAFVGYDQAVLGNQAAEWVAKLTNCQGKVGVIGLVINTTQRIAAFYDHMKVVCPNIILAAQATTDGSTANENATLQAYMVANPDLTLVWWADGDAGGQAQTWKEIQDNGSKAIFLATDMPPTTLQAVKDGIFIGTVAQDTYAEEFWSVIIMDMQNKGYRIPDTVYLSALLIDKSNVDQFLTK